MDATSVTIDLQLSQKDLRELLSIVEISPELRDKLALARSRLLRKAAGMLAVWLLTPYQQMVLGLAVDTTQIDRLAENRTAREAAVWWQLGGRAILLCLKEDSKRDVAAHCDYGLELIPPKQPADLRPEHDGFDSLNLGWFKSRAEAEAEAAKLGLKVVAVEEANR
ncbi:hypothetical protein A6M27_06060 [Acidithiobacillus thiooxidans]|uniref:hypothetical protein n=1 Tax=Acidithiobacillus thiooxidans TaxID=930 RepID=UPI0004637860|nr:hypothetical protein [Acidithiobacillus thiooxidans]OCX83730.1 hypothetical protein A6O26_06455 [Acidithiobacillus thiooxidans]OCX88708.1 hypothetical protein A6M27_06060 [Acidithiobacillus thiooxidans]OFC43627.1 hypothetical protein BAE47_12670 [Acidithiobacillus thiooxidans]